MVSWGTLRVRVPKGRGGSLVLRSGDEFYLYVFAVEGHRMFHLT